MNDGESRLRVQVNRGNATCTGTPTGGPTNITPGGAIRVTVTSTVVTPGVVVVRDLSQMSGPGTLPANGDSLTFSVDDGDNIAFTKRTSGGGPLTPFEGGGVNVFIEVIWRCEYGADPPVDGTLTASRSLSKGPPVSMAAATASDDANRLQLDATKSANEVPAVAESTNNTTTTTTTAPEATTTSSSSSTTSTSTTSTTTTTTAPTTTSATATTVETTAVEATTASAAPAAPTVDPGTTGSSVP
ncbi:MAG: hypothetical protein AAGA42_08630 [Actinomycetota bacterium]